MSIVLNNSSPSLLDAGDTAAMLRRENAALRLTTEALLARNLQLKAQLDQQRDVLDGLHAFVVSVAHALQATRASYAPDPRRSACQHHLASLTSRQREVLAMVVAGHPSKRIASLLRISQRTVENHRAAIMSKTGSASLPALTQLVVLAGVDTYALDTFPQDRAGSLHRPALSLITDVAAPVSPIPARAAELRRG
jgi:DNA-binding NarL/FixJ family response regulator